MKPIKITQEHKEILIRDFMDYLNKKLFTNRIEYTAKITQTLDKTVPKPIINITASAYLKMWTLVQEYNTEIAWHGCVRKQQNTYTIYDILVYPQKVTNATVTTDTKAYGEWLLELDDDSFNHLRFQGHSHAHMGTTPSNIDDDMYQNLLQTLKEGDYYIFAILNKSNQINIWVYDFTQNIVFEKEDITVNVILDQTQSLTLNDWLAAEAKKIDTPKRTPQIYSNPFYDIYTDYVSDIPPTTSVKAKTNVKAKSKKGTKQRK